MQFISLNGDSWHSSDLSFCLSLLLSVQKVWLGRGLYSPSLSFRINTEK